MTWAHHPTQNSGWKDFFKVIFVIFICRPCKLQSIASKQTNRPCSCYPTKPFHSSWREKSEIVNSYKYESSDICFPLSPPLKSLVPKFMIILESQFYPVKIRISHACREKAWKYVPWKLKTQKTGTLVL